MGWPVCKKLLLVGLLFVSLAGCHEERKVHVRRERPAVRRTTVDVAVSRPERRVIVEPQKPEPEVVVERPVVVEREQPRVVVERRRPRIIVREAPPPVIVETPPPPPSRSHIWIEGHWGYDRGKFVWVSGRYERARRGHRYLPARWVQTERGWEFYEGRWER